MNTKTRMNVYKAVKMLSYDIGHFTNQLADKIM